MMISCSVFAATEPAPPEQAWGGLKMLERPSPGNHEYYAYTKHGDNEAAQNGTGYFGYFNGHDQGGSGSAPCRG